MFHVKHLQFFNFSAFSVLVALIGEWTIQPKCRFSAQPIGLQRFYFALSFFFTECCRAERMRSIFQRLISAGRFFAIAQNDSVGHRRVFQNLIPVGRFFDYAALAPRFFGGVLRMPECCHAELVEASSRVSYRQEDSSLSLRMTASGIEASSKA